LYGCLSDEMEDKNEKPLNQVERDNYRGIV